MEGLEPPHLTASDPKSDVSTNFTTSGYQRNSKSQNPKFQLTCLKLGFGICSLGFSFWGCKCMIFFYVQRIENKWKKTIALKTCEIFFCNRLNIVRLNALYLH